MSGPERTVMFQLPSVLAGTLACVGGTMAGRSWDLSAGTFVIGRNEGTDLALTAEPGVSKVHCKIVAEGEHYLLVDCESRNGTIVNGAPIQRVKLRDGDEIRICGCVLRFSQRGGDTQIRVRNADASYETDSEPSSPTAPSALPARHEPPMLLPADALSVVEPSAPPPSIALPPPAPPRLSRGRTLLVWYASGLAGSLLFGGTASAVIFSGGTPPEAVALADDSADPKAAQAAKDGSDAAEAKKPAADADKPDADKPDADKPDADKPDADKPDDKADAAPVDADAPVPALDPAAVKSVADADKPPADPSPDEPKADDPKPDPPKGDEPKDVAAAKTEEPAAAREEDRPRRRTRREEPAAEPASDAPATEQAAKLFAASVEGGKSETLKTRGGKVKSINAADGDPVERGQVLVTFDAGGNEDEVATLRERIASLEGIDDDDARRQLKEARQRLDALQAASKSVPVVAGMNGKLSGFSVAVGDLLKNNQVVGRIAEAGAPKRVRVTVDRATKVKRGARATLILRKGGEAEGTVASTSGRTVVVETGETSADDVESVRF